MMAEAPNPKRRRADDPLEYDFIEKPSADFHCPFTLEILTEPHQTLCCGNHLSQEAADRLKQEGKVCPMCKEPNLNTVPDKFFKRQVNQLKVRCSKKAVGCKWMGELGDLEKHLSEGSVDGECQYTAVSCPLSCGDGIQRHLLEEHKSVCPQRPLVCDYCDYEGTYKNVMEDHCFKCEERPIQCPNKCGENALVRRQLKQHLAQTCPLQVIKCKFSYAGCEIECQRQEMQEHLDGNMQSHLTMVSEMTSGLQDEIIELTDKNDTQEERIDTQEERINTQEIKIQSLTQQVSVLASALYQVGARSLTQPPLPVFIPPPDLVMTDFEKHKNDDDTWYSPPFYSHIGGYKFCISVYANGWDDGEGTHVGVVLHMMRGEYDDNLKWPFKGAVRVQLLNQRGDKGHFKKTLLEPSTYSQDDFDENKYVAQVIEHERAEFGWGCDTFIAHTDLAYNPAKDCQYLMNDCLKFQVTKISL